ncbi:MAG TPA: hypothetical protein VF173_13960 [Thermoanaerobaculia bacterium]|nr:hypothetical protein [Thermoanaerobaculia bacterium]
MDEGADFDLDLTGRRRDDPLPGYARRLLPAIRICSFQLGTVVLFAVLCWGLSRRGAAVPGLPPAVPLVLSLLAATMLLLASRFRATPLRRAIPRSPALPVNADAVLAAYKRGTLLSFAILEFAALLGVGVVMTSGIPAYGIILCVASGFAMLTRWPRAAEVDRLIRGRATP